jgi:hypothetical protein
MFVTLGYDLVEFLAYNGVNVLILSLRDRLALQSGLKRASDIRFDPALDDSSGDLGVLVNGIFELILQILYDKARPTAFGEVECLSMIPELDRINMNEVDLVLVLESDGPYPFDVFILSRSRGVNKEIGEWLPRLSIGHVVLRVHLGNDWDRKSLDPALNLFNCGGSDGVGIGRNGIIKRAIEDDGGRGDPSRFDKSGISGLAEEIIITVLLGSGLEHRSNGIRRGGKVCKGDDLVSLFEFLEVGGSNIRNCGK